MTTHIPPSVIPKISVPRKTPAKRNYQPDMNYRTSQKMIKYVTFLTESLCPPGFSFAKHNHHDVHYKLVTCENSIPEVTESI